jgi:hypothetical protein
MLELPDPSSPYTHLIPLHSSPSHPNEYAFTHAPTYREFIQCLSRWCDNLTSENSQETQELLSQTYQPFDQTGEITLNFSATPDDPKSTKKIALPLFSSRIARITTIDQFLSIKYLLQSTDTYTMPPPHSTTHLYCNITMH